MNKVYRKNRFRINIKTVITYLTTAGLIFVAMGCSKVDKKSNKGSATPSPLPSTTIEIVIDGEEKEEIIINEKAIPTEKSEFIIERANNFEKTLELHHPSIDKSPFEEKYESCDFIFTGDYSNPFSMYDPENNVVYYSDENALDHELYELLVNSVEEYKFDKFTETTPNGERGLFYSEGLLSQLCYDSQNFDSYGYSRFIMEQIIMATTPSNTQAESLTNPLLNKQGIESLEDFLVELDGDINITKENTADLDNFHSRIYDTFVKYKGGFSRIQDRNISRFITRQMRDSETASLEKLSRQIYEMASMRNMLIEKLTTGDDVFEDKGVKERFDQNIVVLLTNLSEEYSLELSDLFGLYDMMSEDIRIINSASEQNYTSAVTELDGVLLFGGEINEFNNMALEAQQDILIELNKIVKSR